MVLLEGDHLCRLCSGHTGDDGHMVPFGGGQLLLSAAYCSALFCDCDGACVQRLLLHCAVLLHAPELLNQLSLALLQGAASKRSCTAP
jgi:hypothetical protein